MNSRLASGSLRDGPDDVKEDAKSQVTGTIDEHFDYDASDVKRLVRKVDWRIMPFLWGYAVLSAVDKVIISNAALYGMLKDNNLVGQQYSWVGSIFYFGYLVAEFPAVNLMARFPIGKFLAIAAMGWSVTTLLMAVTHNAAGLMALRFLMGMCEAPALPGLTLITVMWWRKKEQPLRVAIWSSTVASVYVGLISYGIGNSTLAIASWRLLFIVLGGISFVFSVLMFFFFPDRPEEGKFLSAKEAYIAVHRKLDDNTGIENKDFKWYQVREALIDWKSWVVCLFFLCMNVSNGGLNTFSAQIVSSFGFGPLKTVLLGMPTGVIQAISSILATIPPRYIKDTRCISAAACCIVPLVCSIIIRELPSSNKAGLLTAYYFFYFFWGPYAVALSLPMANTSGHTKKVTVNAMVFLAYCVANIIAPQTFRASEAPHYATGYNSILGFESSAVVLMAVYYVGVKYENRRRDKAYGEVVPGEISVGESMEDLTDWEKKSFRYVC
ncbi:putative transporter [Colletotrichum siamense]|uniref:putative transporter n=1 Tax=Colletotrichum siamense TaxID=690259 RepID=UPI0018722F5E|nr:putative transporter [Colletotrichum siamense]KAF5496968.1 putative transporter [Colletotrichum siamense]